MTLLLVGLITLTAAVSVSTTSRSHDYRYTYGCYESADVRVDVLVDDDVAGYADFSKEEVVWALPHTPQSVKDFEKRAYKIAEASSVHCYSVLGKAKKADPGVPLRQESPSTSIYTRYEGEYGVFNTLFCLASHFYPPSLNFTWRKNNVEVTEGVTNLRYRHNSDGTFHRISTLSFTPQEGDVYSCSVQHGASQQPLTRSWELKNPASPAAVFLGVGLGFCLLGILIGVVLLIKQPH